MIYLDLDGPMTQWTKGVFKLFGRTPGPLTGNADEMLGVTFTEIWARVNKKGAKWWAELDPHPWARRLYEELSRIDEVYILTSPGKGSISADASKGKVQWMHSFFGGDFTQYIITKHKDLLARTGDILIDDMDKNIAEFTEAGGIGIIFPRPWNKAAKDSSRAVDKVLENISQIYPRYTPPTVEEFSDSWSS